MGVKFYTDNWLSASAGVGLLRALENSGIEWKDFIDGNTIDLPQDVFDKLPETYGDYLIKDLTLERFKQILQDRNKKKNFNIYISYIFVACKKIKDFFLNSPLANPSSRPTKEVGDEFNKILETEKDLQKLYSRAKEIIKTFVKNQLEELLTSPKSSKTCFFCGERKAYLKKDGKAKVKAKVFDSTNFTPLAASPNTVENFFWNGKSNMYLCPECEIFLYFSAFGFLRTTRDTYLFVYMPDLKETRDMNNILSTEGNLFSFMNKTIVEASKRIEERKAEWILQNIYIVELEKAGEDKANIYTLSIPPRLAKTIKEMIDKFPEEDFKENVFEIFLDYAYSEKSLYELVFKIMSGFFFKNRYKDLRGKEATLLKVGKDFNYLPHSLTYFIKFQEVLNMEDKNRVNRQVDWAYKEGLKLRNIYKKKMDEDRARKKIESISYRLLDAIRRKDTDAFQQNLIRAYLEAEREIPYVFVEALKDGNFNRIAYAFLIGLNSNGREDERSKEAVG